MSRDFLKGLGIEGETLEKIMAELGKTRHAEHSKEKDIEAAVATETAKLAKEHKAAIDGMKAQLETLASQKAELERSVKESPDVNEAVKKAVEDAEKQHKQALAQIQKDSEAQIATLKRDSETADFLRGLEKKFATPETETIFRQRINDALQDKAFEGKNRADIFAELMKGPDGKERTDVFAQAATQTAAGGHGSAPPPAGNEMNFTFSGIRGRTETD